TFTWLQSASSSSATIIGKDVFTFWPSSGLGEKRVMVPSGASVRKLLKLMSSALAAAITGVSAELQLKPRMSPPLAVEAIFRKSLRFVLTMVESISFLRQEGRHP